MPLKYSGKPKPVPRLDEDRLPYNPFPLATLRATGLSPRAKQVFAILGAHSHYEGYTLVGFKRLVEETGHGTEYVSLAIGELLMAGRITKKARGRKLRKSDRTTLVCADKELLAVGVTVEDLPNYPFGFTEQFKSFIGVSSKKLRTLIDEWNVTSMVEQTNPNVTSTIQNVSSIGHVVSSIGHVVSSTVEQEPSGLEPSALKPSAQAFRSTGRRSGDLPASPGENGNVKGNPNTLAQASLTRSAPHSAPPPTLAKPLWQILEEERAAKTAEFSDEELTEARRGIKSLTFED